MNHAEFLKIGIEIDISVANEATIRNSLGRIYYYTYHEILKFISHDSVLMQIFEDQKESIPSYHKRLVIVLAEASRLTHDWTYGTVSRLLGVLHSMRCEADYDLNVTLNKSHLLSMIAQLDTLRDAAQKLQPTSFDISVLPTGLVVDETKVDSASIKVVRTGYSKDVSAKRSSLRILD